MGVKRELGLNNREIIWSGVIIPKYPENVLLERFWPFKRVYSCITGQKVGEITQIKNIKHWFTVDYALHTCARRGGL